jgi:transposase
VGANPVDRAKAGGKWHVANEAGGMVLSLLLGPANRPDQELLEAVLDDIPPVATPAGGRRRRPGKCHADKADDTRAARSYLTRRGIKVRIARKRVEPRDRLGRHRWKAERTIAWLFGCRRLRVRYDRGSERFSAFGLLACCRLSFNRDTDQTTRRPDCPVLAW